MNKVTEDDGHGAAIHPFVAQDKIAAKAAANQAATFWKSPPPTTEKKSAPPIGAIEGPKGSFS